VGKIRVFVSFQQGPERNAQVVENYFLNLEEEIGNVSRNFLNRLYSLVTLVDGCTCVSLVLENSVPDAGRSNREGRVSLWSSAQVCDWFVRLAQRVRLLIGISTTANRGIVRYRTPACLLAGRDSRYDRENLSSLCSSEANPLPAVSWEVAAMADCGTPKSNAATFVHFLVTTWTSLVRL
jgi:hypothetical protein